MKIAEKLSLIFEMSSSFGKKWKKFCMKREDWNVKIPETNRFVFVNKSPYLKNPDFTLSVTFNSRKKQQKNTADINMLEL